MYALTDTHSIIHPLNNSIRWTPRSRPACVCVWLRVWVCVCARARACICVCVCVWVCGRAPVESLRPSLNIEGQRSRSEVSKGKVQREMFLSSSWCPCTGCRCTSRVMRVGGRAGYTTGSDPDCLFPYRRTNCMFTTIRLQKLWNFYQLSSMCSRPIQSLYTTENKTKKIYLRKTISLQIKPYCNFNEL